MLQARLPTPDQVERAVQRVYERPEFNPKESVFEPLWRMVRRALAQIGEWLGQLRLLETTAPALFWLIIGFLALSAAAIVAHLVWTALQAARAREDDEDGAGGRFRPARPRTADDWEEEARRAAAAGRLREAALALYQALVLRLDARGAVRYDPSKTPGDYRREAARTHPDAARALAAFLRTFEPVAFGGRALDPAGWEKLRSTAGEAGARA